AKSSIRPPMLAGPIARHCRFLSAISSWLSLPFCPRTIPEAARTHIETRTNIRSRNILPELNRRIVESFIASSFYVAPLVEGRSCVIAPGTYHRENGESSAGYHHRLLAAWDCYVFFDPVAISSRINRQERDTSTSLTDLTCD